MDLVDLLTLAQSALLVSVIVVLPVLAVAAIVGLISALFQSATQVHDAALGHLPRLVAVALALLALGPWMGRQLVAFALQAFGAP
jgi:flagellar biosynthesis protein FliQ